MKLIYLVFLLVKMFQSVKIRNGFMSVIVNKTNEILGECKLSDIGHAYSMEIRIDNNCQKNGWSRPLIKTLIESSKLEDNTILCIDADASDGFWEHIGFRLNRYGYDYNGKRSMPGKGYEKICTVRDLKCWINKK